MGFGMRCIKLRLASLLAVLLVTMTCPTLAFAQATLDAVKARGSLIVGVRFDTPPYGFVDASGKNVGIDVDLAGMISKRLGVRLELVQVTGQSRIPTLNSGKVDMLMADLTHTREREKSIDFSATYIHDGVAIMVKKDSGIQSASDLNGKSVSFVQGSTANAALKQVAPQAKITEYQEYPQAFLAFRQGLTDAFISDALTLDQFLKTDGSLEILPKFLAPEPIAIGVRKNDRAWLDTLNGELQDISANGDWATIVKKYVTIPLQAPEVFP